MPIVNVFCDVDPTFVLSKASDVTDGLICGTPIAFPLNEIDDGLPDALWAMDSVAVFAPADDAVNVTVTVCAVAPAFTVNVAGLTVNREASVPPTVIPVTLNAALPVFPTVNVAVAEEFRFALSDSDVVDKEMAGAWPVPVNDTVAAPASAGVAALWAMDREADFAPAEVGANVTVMVCAAAPTAIVAVAGETVN